MSTLSSACVARLNKELRQLEREPPPGVSAWPREGQLNELEAGVCVCAEALARFVAPAGRLIPRAFSPPLLCCSDPGTGGLTIRRWFLQA